MRPRNPKKQASSIFYYLGCAWGFNFAIYILFDKKKKGANHYPRKQENTSSILSLPLLCVRDVSWRTLKMLKEYQQRLFSSPYIYIYRRLSLSIPRQGPRLLSKARAMLGTFYSGRSISITRRLSQEHCEESL